MGNQSWWRDAEFPEEVDVEIGSSKCVDPVTDGSRRAAIGHTNSTTGWIWCADSVEWMTDCQYEGSSCAQHAMYLAKHAAEVVNLIECAIGDDEVN